MSQYTVENKGEFAEIVCPAGRLDVLTFRHVENQRREGWAAAAVGDAEYYRVYQWRDGYAYSRPGHPSLGEFDGACPTRDEAMAACGEDYEVVARLKRWDAYMRSNEPPGVVVPLTGDN